MRKFSEVKTILMKITYAALLRKVLNETMEPLLGNENIKYLSHTVSPFITFSFCFLWALDYYHF